MSLDNTKNSIAARMTKEQKERKEAMDLMLKHEEERRYKKCS